jgi:hypothetical protein
MIQNRLKPALRLLFDTSSAGRDFAAREDDRFVVSYPKSGNTWMRFLLANLGDEEVGFGDIEQAIPDIYQNTASQLARSPSPRILKSHEYFDPRYGTTAFIVRDPRDVVVSYYHYHQKVINRNSGLSLSAFVKAFLEGRLDKFGSWSQNVGSWLGARRGDETFRLLRYEDLKTDPAAELAAVARLFGLPADDAAVAESIRRCGFARMQEMEQKHGTAWKPLAGTRSDLLFVRKGEVGSWKDVLDSADVARIRASCGSLMEQLGYL